MANLTINGNLTVTGGGTVNGKNIATTPAIDILYSSSSNSTSATITANARDYHFLIIEGRRDSGRTQAILFTKNITNGAYGLGFDITGGGYDVMTVTISSSSISLSSSYAYVHTVYGIKFE